MIKTLDDDLTRELAEMGEEEFRRFLFLEAHPDLPGQWLINSDDPTFLSRMGATVRSYRAVAPFAFDAFKIKAEEEGYHIVFLVDPQPTFEWLKNLNATPEVKVNSTMENTVNGLLGFQVQGFNFAKHLTAAVLRHDTGTGKAQPLDSLILTPGGWVTMGELVIGDQIVGLDGQAHPVVGIFPQGGKLAYRLTFSDGSTATSSSDHLWTLEKWAKTRWKGPSERVQHTKPLSEFADNVFVKSGSKASPRGRAQWSLPVAQPVFYHERGDLPLTPYVLGVLLGDGTLKSNGVSLTSDDTELYAEFTGELPPDTAMSMQDRMNIRIIGTVRGRNPVLGGIRYLELAGKRSWEKSIPKAYMRSSYEQRLALLQGLLDTEGSADGASASFTSTSEVMARQVTELVRSLGGYSTEPARRITFYTHKGEKRQGRPSYRVHLSLNDRLFRLERKQSKLKPFRQRRRNLVAVEELSLVEMQCISVTASDNLYITDNYIPTHNSIVASALTKYHREQGNYDLCIWAVKTHNRINTQRAIERNVGLGSMVIDGTKKKRYQQYAEVAHQLDAGHQPIMILNYEKFREDTDALKLLVQGHKVFIVWDEMPTKLRNRATKLYKAVAEVLYTSCVRTSKGVLYFPRQGAERASELRQIMLSATPIVNSPMDWFNTVRLLDASVYGSVNDFQNTFVSEWDQWNNAVRWRRLDYMGAKAAHMTHEVDKSDPDIAVQFPEKLIDPVTVELDPRDRKLYDTLTDEYRKMRKHDASQLTHDEVLAAIGVLQMLVNNPRAVLASARKHQAYLDVLDSGEDAKKIGSQVALKLVNLVNDDSQFTDADAEDEPRCAKLIRLRDDLASGEKTVLFTSMNRTTIPYITEWLDKWDITYVTYHGEMNMKTRQEAEDTFKSDPSVQVFISSDSGSDSINLEVASLVIHYDNPWTWATRHQRENRIDRITSTHARIRILSYSAYNTVEDRRKELIEIKHGHHVAVLKSEIAEQSYKLRTGDYLFILTGENLLESGYE